MSCTPGFFLPVRVLSRLFRLFLERLEAAFFGEPEGLHDPAEFERSLAPLREAECVVLRKGALWRSEPGARLSRPLHPPGGSFQRAAALWERRTGHVSVERLPHEGQTEVEGHDPRKR